MFDHTHHRRIFIVASSYTEATTVALRLKIPFVKWDFVTRPVAMSGLQSPVVLLQDEVILSSELENKLRRIDASMYLENGERYD